MAVRAASYPLLPVFVPDRSMACSRLFVVRTPKEIGIWCLMMAFPIPRGTLPTRFLLLSNELPELADASGAMASRFIVLTLRNSFYGREDTETHID